MEIERRYTTEGKDPYEGISFVERTSRIVNPDGSGSTMHTAPCRILVFKLL